MEVLGKGVGRIPAEILDKYQKILAIILIVVLLLLTIAIGTASALPVGGEIMDGTGAIVSDDNSMTIKQVSPEMIVNWQSFNIGSQERVEFLQPSRDALAINRVMGNEPSQIFGQLQSNGKIFLINPNGILFAQNAQVDVGGLVASTLNLTNKDILEGKYTFANNMLSSAIFNQGQITAKDNGYVVLLSSQVTNEGLIAVNRGMVTLGAGEKITLDLMGQW